MSDLVEIPEDMFPHDAAHIPYRSNMIFYLHVMMKIHNIDSNKELTKTNLSIIFELHLMCFISFQESVETFITPDKLDAELDKLLNSRVDYDFALNLDGTTTKDKEKLEKNDNENAS